MAKMEALYAQRAVTRRLSKVTETQAAGRSNDVVPYGATYDQVNLVNGKYILTPIDGGGSYTFQGSVTADNTKLIPSGAYFLGTKGSSKYPKFWRETGPETRTSGYWQQYTAVVIPDSAAKTWEEENLDTQTADANGNSIFLGEVEYVTTDEIEDIVAQAEEKGQKVQYLNIVVNINGQVVRQGTDLHGLPSGIYIVNGKKYVVK